MDKTLEKIISSTNLSRVPRGNQAVALSKDKLRPSYDFSMSYEDIKQNLTKTKYSFTFGNGVQCLWQPEARFKFLCLDQDLGVKHRKETLFITKKQSIIAKVDFTIYKIVDDMGLDSFYYACDCDSQEGCDFATTVEDVFKLEDRTVLFSDEEYVEFTLLQVTKEYKGSCLWIEAVNTFIDKRFSSINSIYMVLKAFPIEYTGIVDEQLPAKNHRDFVARQSAMLRYYSKVLHVTKIPNQVWLYRKLYGANF